MTKTLIPRSDSISAKIIEPTDFTKLHSSDLIQNYIISGFTISAGSGLACNVAAGSGRLNGLYISSDATETKSSLTASSTNSIYIKLDLDSGSEPEGWSLFSNTSGGAVTNAVLLGTAVTDGSSVTSVTNVVTSKPYNLSTSNTELIPFNVLGDQSLQNIGSGTSGDVLYSNGTNWTKLAKGSDGQYLKLVSGVPAWTTLEDQKGTVTVQHFNVAGTTNNTYQNCLNGDPTFTVATRANGKFLMIANLKIRKSGNNHGRFTWKINGSESDGFVVRGTGEVAKNDGTMNHTQIFTGALDGKTFELWGDHQWSSNNNWATEIIDSYGTDGGGWDNPTYQFGRSSITIFEWSEA